MGAAQGAHPPNDELAKGEEEVNTKLPDDGRVATLAGDLQEDPQYKVCGATQLNQRATSDHIQLIDIHQPNRAAQRTFPTVKRPGGTLSPRSNVQAAYESIAGHGEVPHRGAALVLTVHPANDAYGDAG